MPLSLHGMGPSGDSVSQRLSAEIARASRVVYKLGSSSKVQLLKTEQGENIFVKREDTSFVHSYKWRGAFYAIHELMDKGDMGPFVTTSAGNHGQGVAVSARKLNTSATIFMPRTTPALKVKAVERLGGDAVEVVLVGDNFDQAHESALDHCNKSNATMIPPFDNLYVVAGQATVAVEIFRQLPHVEELYVPIGGGGLAAGVAYYVKTVLEHPCRLIGVEQTSQNSMQLSCKVGKRSTLSSLDTFCDGTAVAMPGELTWTLCKELLDDIKTVSNTEVCHAIKFAWDAGRFVPEPSAALGLAAMLKDKNSPAETRATVITGSNMDFQTFARIVKHAGATKRHRRYFQFTISESQGALIDLLDRFMPDMNIVDFQYGKSDSKTARPVLGIEGPELQLERFVQRQQQNACEMNEISGTAYSMFRVIPFRPDICRNPWFIRIDFPNRPGALRQLMREINAVTNICYFNFEDSGESEGHAMIGFELLFDLSRDTIVESLDRLGFDWSKDNVNGQVVDC